MLSSALAFRPATVVDRLPRRSGACPISARDLLAAASEAGLVLPLVRAPIAAVARGAIVAAKEGRAIIGLSLPDGVPSRPWFDEVAQAADELAAGLPMFLCGEVVVAGEGGTQVERAASEAWRLVDDGLTHLAIDLAAVSVPERGRVALEVARAGFERGLSVELVVPLAEGRQVGARAAALFEELARQGTAPDLLGVRCPAPGDEDEARMQAVVLARISQALGGVPLMRRGPLTPRLVSLLRASPVKACEDGGAAAASALGLLPELPAGDAPDPELPPRDSPLARAAAALPRAEADRLEARAYVEVLDLVDRLGARGGAWPVIRALRQRLVDR